MGNDGPGVDDSCAYCGVSLHMCDQGPAYCCSDCYHDIDGKGMKVHPVVPDVERDRLVGFLKTTWLQASAASDNAHTMLRELGVTYPEPTYWDNKAKDHGSRDSASEDASAVAQLLIAGWGLHNAVVHRPVESNLMRAAMEEWSLVAARHSQGVDDA